MMVDNRVHLGGSRAASDRTASYRSWCSVTVQTNLDLNTQAFVLVLGLVLGLVLVRKLRRLDLDNREVLDQAVVSLVVAFLLRPVGSVDRCSDRPDFVGTAQRVIDGPSEDPLFGGNPKFVVALGPVENSPS